MTIPFAPSRSSAERLTLTTGASRSTVAISAAAPPIAPIEHPLGSAFDASSHEIHTESHGINEKDGESKHLILFKCAGGKAFARRHVEVARQVDPSRLTRGVQGRPPRRPVRALIRQVR